MSHDTLRAIVALEQYRLTNSSLDRQKLQFQTSPIADIWEL